MRRFDERIRKGGEGPVEYQAEPKLHGSSLKLVRWRECRSARSPAVGNVTGSSIFNLTAVLGPAVVIEPLSIASGVPGRECPAMLILSAPVWPMAWFALQARRWQGFFLLVPYAVCWLWPGGTT